MEKPQPVSDDRLPCFGDLGAWDFEVAVVKKDEEEIAAEPRGRRRNRSCSNPRFRTSSPSSSSSENEAIAPRKYTIAAAAEEEKEKPKPRSTVSVVGDGKRHRSRSKERRRTPPSFAETRWHRRSHNYHYHYHDRHDSRSRKREEGRRDAESPYHSAIGCAVANFPCDDSGCEWIRREPNSLREICETAAATKREKTEKNVVDELTFADMLRVAAMRMTAAMLSGRRSFRIMTVPQRDIQRRCVSNSPRIYGLARELEELLRRAGFSVRIEPRHERAAYDMYCSFPGNLERIPRRK